MSITSPFFLRSSTGAIHLKVTESHVSEICLFEDRIACEQYPLKVQDLVSKTILFGLKETSTEIFEQAQHSFFERLGTKSVLTLPPPTPKQVEQAITISEALKDELPF